MTVTPKRGMRFVHSRKIDGETGLPAEYVITKVTPTCVYFRGPGGLWHQGLERFPESVGHYLEKEQA
jgi:hypothetical protein